MTWQDIILSAGSWIFIIALLPSLFGKDKPPITTSILTGSVLLVYAITYFTLHFWFSVASTGILSIAWITLAFQKTRTTKRAPE